MAKSASIGASIGAPKSAPKSASKSASKGAHVDAASCAELIAVNRGAMGDALLEHYPAVFKAIGGFDGFLEVLVSMADPTTHTRVRAAKRALCTAACCAPLFDALMTRTRTNAARVAKMGDAI